MHFLISGLGASRPRFLDLAAPLETHHFPNTLLYEFAHFWPGREAPSGPDSWIWAPPWKPTISLILLFMNLLISGLGASRPRFLDLAAPLETYHFLNTSLYEFAHVWPGRLQAQMPPRFLDLAAPWKPTISLILLFMNLLMSGLGASRPRFLDSASLEAYRFLSTSLHAFPHFWPGRLQAQIPGFGRPPGNPPFP